MILAMARPEKLRAERIQTATWGVLIIWVGIMMASRIDNDNEGVGMFVLGLIFLASGLLQRFMARREGVGFVIAGVVLALVGANDLFSDGELSVGAIVVVVIGALLLASAFRPKRGVRITIGSDEDEPE